MQTIWFHLVWKGFLEKLGMAIAGFMVYLMCSRDADDALRLASDVLQAVAISVFRRSERGALRDRRLLSRLRVNNRAS